MVSAIDTAYLRHLQPFRQGNWVVRSDPGDARSPPPPPLSPSQCSDCCSCSGPLACCSRDSSLLQVSEGWLGRVLSCRDDVVVQFDDGSQVAPDHTIAPRLRCTPSS